MPYKDKTNKNKKNKIYYLRWCIKHGKTGYLGSKFCRDLRPDEIAERKERLEVLLAARQSTQPESTEPTLAPGTHHLYIMENSRLSGEVKIGYSKDVERRRKELEAGQNFKMIVLAIFPGKGYLEKRVHAHLGSFRVTEYTGTEWFKCSLGEALAGIDQVMRCA